MKSIHDIRLDNLNLLVQEAGGITELSKLAGYKQPSYLYQIINRTPVQNGKAKNIGNAMAAKLEEIMNKPQGWMDAIHARPPESNATFIGNVHIWDDDTPVDADEVEVPFLKDICLAAGYGIYDEINDYNGRKLRFSRSTLMRKGISHHHVVCVTANGSSMEPVIPDGSTIGINTEETNIKDGKIYAINHDGLLRIKILKNRPGANVLLQSYNREEYPDEEIEITDIRVLGRVFWWSVLD